MDNSCPNDSILIKVLFHDGPLGVSLRRRPDGTVFVSSIVKGSQADGLDIQETDDLWGIGPSVIGKTALDKEAWEKFIGFVKVARRPLEMVFRRKKTSIQASNTKLTTDDDGVTEENDNDNEQEENDNNNSDNYENDNDDTNEDAEDAEEEGTALNKANDDDDDEEEEEEGEEEVEIRLHDRDIQELKELASKLVFKKELKGITNILTTLNSTKNMLTHQKHTLVDNSAAQIATAHNGSVQKFLVKEGRQFIKSGQLVVISNQVFKLNAEDKRQFFLFTDILIIAAHTSSDNFQIESVFDLQICKVDLGKYVTDSLPTDGEAEHISVNPSQLVFDIISPFGTIKVLTSSPEEKDVWTMVLCAAILNCIGSDVKVALGFKHHYVLGTIHSAVINRDETKVAELVQLCESGLQDFSTIEESDDDGYSPLHYAAILRSHSIVKILHEASADVTARDRNGYTPLHWAAMQLDDVTLTMLASHIFDTDLEDDHGRTPLFLACVEGRGISGKTDIDALKRCLTCLISLQANTDVKDKNNISALQYLAASWQYDAMKLLLDDKVDPNYVSGKFAFSALHYVANASPLKKAKGEASKVLLNFFQDDGDLEKPEEINIRGGVMTLKALLEAGAKPNFRDSRGKTAIQIIGENSEVWGSNLSEAIGTLLSYGARLDESAQVSILRSKCADISFESIIEEWAKDQTVNADTVAIPINGLANTSSTTSVQHTDGKERCLLCSTQFTLFRRQHHCRLCGILCCDDCSKKRASVQNELIRSCDSCFNIVHNKVTQVKNRILLNSMKPRSTPSPTQQAEYSRQKSSEQVARFDLFSGAKTITSDEKKKDVHGNMTGTMSAMSEAKQRLNERGEKLNRLQDKTADLSNAASDFAKLAKQLNQKSKNSWF